MYDHDIFNKLEIPKNLTLGNLSFFMGGLIRRLSFQLHRAHWRARAVVQRMRAHVETHACAHAQLAL